MQRDIILLRLKRQLGQLPGRTSHLKMLPPGRIPELPFNQVNYHESAVMILLFPYQDQIEICLIRRPSTMKNHAGQIAFPGGRKEVEDTNLVQTALREAYEEIGLNREVVEILGVMSPVYVQISNFVITPVLGWTNSKPELKVDHDEVDELLFVSLDELADPNNLCEREMETKTGRIIAPGYEIGGHFIWGATAMMLAELRDMYSADYQL
jgi:8-oxo-dGTP pyrophosphatase MutT (NUDIX family)